MNFTPVNTIYSTVGSLLFFLLFFLSSSSSPLKSLSYTLITSLRSPSQAFAIIFFTNVMVHRSFYNFGGENLNETFRSRLLDGVKMLAVSCCCCSCCCSIASQLPPPFTQPTSRNPQIPISPPIPPKKITAPSEPNKLSEIMLVQ